MSKEYLKNKYYALLENITRSSKTSICSTARQQKHCVLSPGIQELLKKVQLELQFKLHVIPTTSDLVTVRQISYYMTEENISKSKVVQEQLPRTCQVTLNQDWLP